MSGAVNQQTNNRKKTWKIEEIGKQIQAIIVDNK